MSLGGGPLDDAWGKQRRDSFADKAEADRAARLAGHKSLFRRLLDRLRLHRQEPGDDSHSSYGTSDDPGH
jgi:hypothetical protein